PRDAAYPFRQQTACPVATSPFAAFRRDTRSCPNGAPLGRSLARARERPTSAQESAHPPDLPQLAELAGDGVILGLRIWRTGPSTGRPAALSDTSLAGAWWKALPPKRPSIAGLTAFKQRLGQVFGRRSGSVFDRPRHIRPTAMAGESRERAGHAAGFSPTA